MSQYEKFYQKRDTLVVFLVLSTTAIFRLFAATTDVDHAFLEQHRFETFLIKTTKKLDWDCAHSLESNPSSIWSHQA